MRYLTIFLIYVWVLPNTLLGLLVGFFGLVTGGRLQIVRGVVEFHGGVVTWLLRRLPPMGVAAMTLGHSILGQNQHDLARARDHEHVHVRQYQRWGPFFIPCYLLCSLLLWFQNKDYYLDNPFEVEAYDISDPGRLDSPDPEKD